MKSQRHSVPGFLLFFALGLLGLLGVNAVVTSFDGTTILFYALLSIGIALLLKVLIEAIVESNNNNNHDHHTYDFE